MNKFGRLTGIDLFRGLAVYAVVVLHTDEGVTTLPFIWDKLIDFSGFAVPFFLATSFFLAIAKLYRSPDQFQLQPRLLRLLVPYCFWSIFYLLFKFTKYAIASDSSKVADLFRDPLALVFFGGAAFHLYFLPLLAAGTILLKVAEMAIRNKVSLPKLTLLCLGSLVLYQALIMTGNDFQNEAKIAFQGLLTAISPLDSINPLLRWLAIELAWMIRCLPLVLFGLIWQHPQIQNSRLNPIDKNPILLLFIFIAVNILSLWILPQGIGELAKGYSALIAAIAVSQYIGGKNRIIESVGNCSFGIYLVHLFFVEIFQSVMHRLNPSYTTNVSALLLISASIVIFMISWLATIPLTQNKRLSKVLFGA